MRGLVGLVVVAVVLGGCVNTGPEILASCLDDRVMKQYRSSSAGNKMLVGGVSPSGSAHCFWSPITEPTHVRGNLAFKNCEKAATKCTLIAVNDKVDFASNPDAGGLLGAFLFGAASGAVSNMNRPSYEPAPAPALVQPYRPPLQCSPSGPALPGQAPNYTCR